jgi:hypothetical protein
MLPGMALSAMSLVALVRAAEKARRISDRLRAERDTHA